MLREERYLYILDHLTNMGQCILRPGNGVAENQQKTLSEISLVENLHHLEASDRLWSRTACHEHADVSVPTADIVSS